MPLDTPIVGAARWPVADPLLRGLENRGCEFRRFDSPDTLFDEFVRGALTCALLPVHRLIEYPELRIVPGAGLVARSGMCAEGVAAPDSWDTTATVWSPPGAETVTLYARLLREMGRWPLGAIAVGEGAEGGARLVTSLVGGHLEAPRQLDLAALWEEATDLPLVLAAWACAGPVHTRSLRQLLAEVARDGAPAESAYRYSLLSAECDCLRLVHQLARKHAIGGASVESMAFC